MSFERVLHFRMTPFASVGDILKAVDEENRRNCVIDISLLQFGQISMVLGNQFFAPTLSFFAISRVKNLVASKTKCGRNRRRVRAHP
jgi:hypothetical protein